jgi:hypothetical protein
MLSETEIEEVKKEVELKLLNNTKIGFDFKRNWSSNFPQEAGIYAIFDKEELIYVGETAHLKERMKEVKRTYNHSLKGKLSRKLYQVEKRKGKLPAEIETKLNEYFKNNLTFSYCEVPFGRLEIETYLVIKYWKEDGSGLINSVSRRSQLL